MLCIHLMYMYKQQQTHLKKIFTWYQRQHTNYRVTHCVRIQFVIGPWYGNYQLRVTQYYVILSTVIAIQEDAVFFFSILQNTGMLLHATRYLVQSMHMLGYSKTPRSIRSRIVTFVEWLRRREAVSATHHEMSNLLWGWRGTYIRTGIVKIRTVAYNVFITIIIAKRLIYRISAGCLHKIGRKARLTPIVRMLLCRRVSSILAKLSLRKNITEWFIYMVGQRRYMATLVQLLQEHTIVRKRAYKYLTLRNIYMYRTYKDATWLQQRHLRYALKTRVVAMQQLATTLSAGVQGNSITTTQPRTAVVATVQDVCLRYLQMAYFATAGTAQEQCVEHAAIALSYAYGRECTDVFALDAHQVPTVLPTFDAFHAWFIQCCTAQSTLQYTLALQPFCADNNIVSVLQRTVSGFKKPAMFNITGSIHAFKALALAVAPRNSFTFVKGKMQVARYISFFRIVYWRYLRVLCNKAYARRRVRYVSMRHPNTLARCSRTVLPCYSYIYKPGSTLFRYSSMSMCGLLTRLRVQYLYYKVVRLENALPIAISMYRINDVCAIHEQPLLPQWQFMFYYTVLVYGIYQHTSMLPWSTVDGTLWCDPVSDVASDARASIACAPAQFIPITIEHIDLQIAHSYVTTAVTAWLWLGTMYSILYRCLCDTLESVRLNPRPDARVRSIRVLRNRYDVISYISDIYSNANLVQHVPVQTAVRLLVQRIQCTFAYTHVYQNVYARRIARSILKRHARRIKYVQIKKKYTRIQLKRARRMQYSILECLIRVLRTYGAHLLYILHKYLTNMKLIHGQSIALRRELRYGRCRFFIRQVRRPFNGVRWLRRITMPDRRGIRTRDR